MLQSLTPDIFDALIVGVIVIGLALVAVRLYADFSRPLPPPARSQSDEDTQPTKPTLP